MYLINCDAKYFTYVVSVILQKCFGLRLTSNISSRWVFSCIGDCCMCFIFRSGLCFRGLLMALFSSLRQYYYSFPFFFQPSPWFPRAWCWRVAPVCHRRVAEQWRLQSPSCLATRIHHQSSCALCRSQHPSYPPATTGRSNHSTDVGFLQCVSFPCNLTRGQWTLSARRKKNVRIEDCTHHSTAITTQAGHTGRCTPGITPHYSHRTILYSRPTALLWSLASHCCAPAKRVLWSIGSWSDLPTLRNVGL
jgi:hypothetical protein